MKFVNNYHSDLTLNEFYVTDYEWICRFSLSYGTVANLALV